MTDLSIALPAEIVEAIAQRAAELVLEQLATLSQSNGPRWLYGAKAAADYLNVPVGKVQKLTADGAIPHHRPHGQRVMYRTDELDAWLAESYEGPPRLRAVQ